MTAEKESAKDLANPSTKSPKKTSGGKPWVIDVITRDIDSSQKKTGDSCFWSYLLV
jgi:hypothetical protein